MSFRRGTKAMQLNDLFATRRRSRRKPATRTDQARKVRSQAALECLEDRTLLSYTFALSGQTATVSPVASTGGPILIDEVVVGGNPLLQWSQNNGVTFSTDWDDATPGTQTLPATTASTINLTPTTGAGSSITLGTLTSAASNIFAHFNLGAVGAPANNSLIIDDRTSTQAAGTYDFYSVLGSITGPGGATGGINFTSFGPIHSYLAEGGPAGNTFNIHSTFNATTVSTKIVGGAGDDTANVLGDTFPGIGTPLSIDLGGGANTVNVGNGNLGATISAPVTVADTGGTTALSINDQNDTTGQTWTLNNDDGTDTGSVAVTGSGTTSYTPSVLSSLTINGGSGGNALNVNQTSSHYATTLNSGTGNDTVNVLATGNSTLDVHGQAGTDTVTLGGSTSAPLGMQGLAGTINVDNAGGSTDLVLDDSQDTVAQTATLSNDGTNGQVTGLSPATINYVNAGTDSLAVKGGSGGNTFTVNGTLVNGAVPNTLTTLDKGSGPDNTVNIAATSAGSVLNLTGTGTPDTVTFTNPANNNGKVTINEAPGSTNLVVDLSNDGLPHVLDLSSDGTTGTLHDELGNMPSDITYNVASLSSLTIDTSAAAAETLNLNFGGGGNPIPTAGSPGLIFNAGADFGNAFPHVLNIFGQLPTGPFTSETHNANDENVFPQIGQYGSIAFVDAGAVSTSLNYTGTLPITDTTPATLYTFNDFADDQSFSAKTGPVVGGFQTIEFANTPSTPPPTFETTDIANKTNVVFNTPDKGKGLTGLVDIPTASAGLASLTFNTPANGDNQVTFVNTPPGVATSLNAGPEEDVTRVIGKGVPAGTTLVLNGGQGVDTLDYNAGGLTPTITAGAAPGEVIISLPGFGTVDATNYEQINITNVAPVTITPGPAVTINSVEGFRLTDALVGTFTLPQTIIPTPPGALASDFTATIDWGDPSPDLTAGTITQDASNPSVYDITGTHTFTEQGTFTVANTVSFAGGTFTTIIGGVPVTVTLAPSGPTAGTPATAVVTQGTLSVTPFPIVGTEGVAIAAAPIGTFIDAGGAKPVADYTARIIIVDATGAVVVNTPAASITQNDDSAQYTVHAPALTLPEAGTYSVRLVVTDTDTPGPVTSAGWTTATIADAKLSPSATQPTVTPTEAALFTVPVFAPPLFRGPVASFTDANTTAPVGDFTATIDWGDGTPPSIGTISQPGGVGTAFVVSGAHTYADSGVNGGTGSYLIQVLIQDVDGARLTVTNTATVADKAITLTGQLDTASDSGKFNNDAITNVTEPVFHGTSEPFSHVALFANGTSIGQVQAGSDGSWTITSSHLADGSYAITATAVDQFGITTTPAPVTIVPNLVIDTVGPRVTFAAFDRLTATVTYTFQDFLQDGVTPGGSGLLVQSLSDAANYSLNRVHPRPPGTFIVTSISVTPGAAPLSQDVTVVFNNGHPLRGGFFQIIARAKSVLLAGGIQDVAGNALDGEFYGPQSASGNGIPGGDFIANIKELHHNNPPHGNSGPVTIIGFPHPNDPPAKFLAGHKGGTKGTASKTVHKPTQSALSRPGMTITTIHSVHPSATKSMGASSKGHK
jgi:hypothetical protein